MGDEAMQYHAPLEYYKCQHPFSLPVKINGKSPEYLLTYERTYKEQRNEEKLSIEYVTQTYALALIPSPNGQSKGLIFVNGKLISHPDRERTSAYDLDERIVQGLTEIPCNNAQRFLKTHVPGYSQFRLDRDCAEAVNSISGAYALIAENKNNARQYLVFFEKEMLTLLHQTSEKLTREHPHIAFSFVPLPVRDYERTVQSRTDKIKQKRTHILFGPNGQKK